jgi:hypothetical protein
MGGAGLKGGRNAFVLLVKRVMYNCKDCTKQIKRLQKVGYNCLCSVKVY